MCKSPLFHIYIQTAVEHIDYFTYTLRNECYSPFNSPTHRIPLKCKLFKSLNRKLKIEL